MNKFSLKELGAQYLQESNNIRERIKTLKAQLNLLPDTEKQDLLIRINSLYSSARDAKDIGNYLFNYYGDTNEKNY